MEYRSKKIWEAVSQKEQKVGENSLYKCKKLSNNEVEYTEAKRKRQYIKSLWNRAKAALRKKGWQWTYLKSKQMAYNLLLYLNKLEKYE